MRRTSNSYVFAMVALGGLLSLAAAANATTQPGDPHARAYLGVHVGDVTQPMLSELKLKDTHGALVISLDQDGPACRAGLQEKDVILSLNGQRVENPGQLAELVIALPAGKPANVTVWRSGQAKEMKVTPGTRSFLVGRGPHGEVIFPAGGMPMPPATPMPPMSGFMPDVDMPIVTPAAVRNGLMVESLTPQLAEFFGVPRGQGLLVRSVERGSPAANAGIKAGDVIVKVNGQEIHDLQDWRSSMKARGKVSVGVYRDKKQQTMEMTVPGPATGSELKPENMQQFEKDMHAWQQQMQELQPQLQQQTELATQAMLMNHDELDQMQRDLEKSMKKMDPQLKKQTREIEKSMKKMEPELRKQSKDIQKQMQKMQPEMERQAREMQKQMEAMRPEVEKQTAEIRKQMEVMGPELAKQAAEMQKSLQLNADEIKKMGESVREQMKTLGPEIQKEMDEFQKQMQEQQNDWGRDGAKPNQL